ncbi:XRE family transcriptional regulator [Streptomyces phytophilus]|uniref:XRE family transcriptional regulator n=1 Tax=Streptomyces phytophilus TaxID=722715 RepID=UPI001C689D7E|nr:XRE family transcriptional regulator [Streptomyces phytophilus]
MAEELGVDTTTVQGWESGRRPLTAIPTAQLLSLRRHLLRTGADPALLVLLDDAMEADSVIGYALEARHAHEDFRDHPLAGWVFTRSVTHMLTWAINGAAPAALPPPSAPVPRRRGPTPAAPVLSTDERHRFFGHLRRFAEIADAAGEEGALLRRQALYLCSYDSASDTRAWLAEMQSRRTTHLAHAVWAPAWSDARSLATSLTRHGDVEMLHAFIERGMSSDAGETANLNYWAHWLGLDRLPRPDDSFMAGPSFHSWDPGALLRSLVDRLDPALGCVDLNVHSVWALVASRPGLLAADHRGDLQSRVSLLLDGDRVSSRARRELDSLHYGLRLSRP